MHQSRSPLVLSCALGLVLGGALEPSARAEQPRRVAPRSAPLERILRQARQEASRSEELPEPQENDLAKIDSRSIHEIKTDIAPRGSKANLKIPTSSASPRVQLARTLDEPRSPDLVEFNWQSPGTHHRPLYFEEVNLERHGYSKFGVLQPAASAAHFFATIPLLPYKMTVHPAQEHIYTLGHYRPGSCVPYRIHQLPLYLDAATVQAGVVTSLVFLIP